MYIKWGKMFAQYCGRGVAAVVKTIDRKVGSSNPDPG